MINTEKYVLIGHPLGHSMSPFIHEKLFEIAGRRAEYICMDIAPEELAGKSGDLKKLSGYNITIPHKTEIIQYLDELDETAERYNAVNCVYTKDGISRGYNTDCVGFLRSVERFPLSGKVLLVGAGGAGRMMAVEALRHGAELTIAVRNPDGKVKNLLEELKEKYPDSTVKLTAISEISGKYDVLLNSTPVGMYPNGNNCPVSDEVIENCDYFFDAIYNPIKTVLVKKAEALGKTAVGGMAMLVGQAVAAHEIWNGDSYTEEQVSEIIRSAEKKVNEDFR